MEDFMIINKIFLVISYLIGLNFSILGSDILEMRDTFFLYNQDDELYCIKISITSFKDDYEKKIYMLAKNFKKNIIITRIGINKLYNLIEKIEGMQDENLSKEEYEKYELLKDEIIKNFSKETPIEVEINDEGKKGKYILFDKDDKYCIIEKKNITLCDKNAFNYISKGFSEEIKCLLTSWGSYWGKEYIKPCFEKKEKSEFISCEKAEANLGFDCSKWNNVRVVKNLQRIYGK
jgi:hypothetical protein